MEEEDFEDSFATRDAETRRKIAKACLCHPDTTIKKVWELFISVILIVACFITPYSLAFESLNSEERGFFIFSDGWSATESVVDIIFMIEIVVCFNSSYYDMEANQYVTSRKQIAKKYLKGWFWIDILAVMPRFLRDFEAEDDSNEFL